MEFVDIGNDRFFWVNYKALLDDMPILSISKRALYDRLQKMVKFGLLKHHHHKSGGNFSYYCTGPNYQNLLASPYEADFNTFGRKLPNLMNKTSEPYGSELPNKDPSTNDPSSKNNFARKRFTPPTDVFAKFWAAYPRKVGKAACEEWFARHKVDDTTVNCMIASLEYLKTTEQWRKEGGKYIPYPQTWLNGRRWEDETAQPPKKEETRWLR